MPGVTRLNLMSCKRLQRLKIFVLRIPERRKKERTKQVTTSEFLGAKSVKQAERAETQHFCAGGGRRKTQPQDTRKQIELARRPSGGKKQKEARTPQKGGKKG